MEGQATELMDNVAVELTFGETVFVFEVDSTGLLVELPQNLGKCDSFKENIGDAIVEERVWPIMHIDGGAGVYMKWDDLKEQVPSGTTVSDAFDGDTIRLRLERFANEVR